MHVEPQKEHQWLQKLIGEWTIESEAIMEPGKPPTTFAGKESVRSVGGLWMVCEGQCEMPGGGTGITIMTLGYDPAKMRFLGTFIGSMMTHMWIYDGELDAAGTALALNAEGPSFADASKTAKYIDKIEFKSDDHRVLSSSFLADDGTWRSFMTANFRRVK